MINQKDIGKNTFIHLEFRDGLHTLLTLSPEGVIKHKYLIGQEGYVILSVTPIKAYPSLDQWRDMLYTEESKDDLNKVLIPLFDELVKKTYKGFGVNNQFQVVKLTNEVLFRFKDKDGVNGISRATFDTMVSKSGLKQNELIHVALMELVKRYLPDTYNDITGVTQKAKDLHLGLNEEWNHIKGNLFNNQAKLLVKEHINRLAKGNVTLYDDDAINIMRDQLVKVIKETDFLTPKRADVLTAYLDCILNHYGPSFKHLCLSQRIDGVYKLFNTSKISLAFIEQNVLNKED